MLALACWPWLVGLSALRQRKEWDSVGVNQSSLLYSSVSGGGPFTFSNQQGTVVHDLSVDDKDYISVAEEVIK